MATHPAEIDSIRAMTVTDIIEGELATQGGRWRSLFGRALSPEAALHQSIFSFADQAVASGTNFLTGVIIGHLCSKAELGLYTLGFSLVTLITSLQISLITTPYMVYAPRLERRAHALYTGSALLHQLVFCLIAMLGVMGGALVVGHGIGPMGLGPVLRALVLVIAPMMLREHARRIIFARLQFTTALIFDSFIALGQIGGLLLLARFGLLSASCAYLVTGLVCGIAVLGWLWSDRRFYHLQISESLADFKKNCTLGKWVFASGLVWTVVMNLYPWLLAAFHGVASTGVWAACLGVISIGNPMLKGIQNLVGPKIAHLYASQGPRALHRLVLKITALIAIPIALLCAAMVTWGGSLLVLLYGKQYAGNSLVVAILALNLLVGAVTISFSPALFAVNRARMDFIANLAALFIITALGVWLVWVFGALGAALGLLGASVAASAVRTTVFLRSPTSIVGQCPLKS